MTRPKTSKGLGWWKTPGFKLDPRGRRAILEALGPTNVLPQRIIAGVEADLVIATAWRESQVPVAGRRRLLDQLILAATSFERALLDLDHESWDELARTVDRRSAELPLSFQRYFAERLSEATLDKRESVSKGVAVLPIPPAVPAAITEILRAARAQRARLGVVKTRGKRREDARDNLIKRLAETFHNAAHGKREYRGRLIDFVRAALTGAGLRVPESEEKVWALVPNKLRNPREGPPN